MAPTMIPVVVSFYKYRVRKVIEEDPEITVGRFCKLLVESKGSWMLQVCRNAAGGVIPAKSAITTVAQSSSPELTVDTSVMINYGDGYTTRVLLQNKSLESKIADPSSPLLSSFMASVSLCMFEDGSSIDMSPSDSLWNYMHGIAKRRQERKGKEYLSTAPIPQLILCTHPDKSWDKFSVKDVGNKNNDIEMYVTDQGKLLYFGALGRRCRQVENQATSKSIMGDKSGKVDPHSRNSAIKKDDRVIKKKRKISDMFEDNLKETEETAKIDKSSNKELQRVTSDMIDEEKNEDRHEEKIASKLITEDTADDGIVSSSYDTIKNPPKKTLPIEGKNCKSRIINPRRSEPGDTIVTNKVTTGCKPGDEICQIAKAVNKESNTQTSKDSPKKREDKSKNFDCYTRNSKSETDNAVTHVIKSKEIDKDARIMDEIEKLESTKGEGIERVSLDKTEDYKHGKANGLKVKGVMIPNNSSEFNRLRHGNTDFEVEKPMININNIQNVKDSTSPKDNIKSLQDVQKELQRIKETKKRNASGNIVWVSPGMTEIERKETMKEQRNYRNLTRKLSKLKHGNTKSEEIDKPNVNKNNIKKVRDNTSPKQNIKSLQDVQEELQRIKETKKRSASGNIVWLSPGMTEIERKEAMKEQRSYRNLASKLNKLKHDNIKPEKVDKPNVNKKIKKVRDSTSPEQNTKSLQDVQKEIHRIEKTKKRSASGTIVWVSPGMTEIEKERVRKEKITYYRLKKKIKIKESG